MIVEQCAMPMYKYVTDKSCSQPYNIFMEDTGTYTPGWLPVANESGELVISIVA